MHGCGSVKGKEMEELISIIVPVYNVEKYLEKCVQTILEQTYKNYELILVDDGSKDGSGLICDEIQKNDNRVKVIHKENGGLSSARNAGIRVARGNFFVFIDSDDTIDATMLERLYAALSESKASLAICSYDFVDEKGKLLEKKNEIQDGVYSSYQMQKLLNSDKYWYYVTAWNKLYKRSLFDDIEFPEGKINEDQFIAHRIVDKADRVVVIKDQLYHYLKRSNSITATINVKRLDDTFALQDRINYYESHGLKELCPDVERLAIKLYPAVRMQLIGANKLDRKSIKKADAVIRNMYMQYTDHKSFKRIISITFPELYYRLLKWKKRKLEKRKEQVDKLIRLMKYAVDVRKCSFVLMDTPTHENLGDHAIVLAEMQVVKECSPSCKIHETTAIEINHQERFFAAVTPMNQYILVNGGGFLGALWPDEEERFRRIVQAFKKQKIIVFPQTVTFDSTTPEGRKYLEESQQIYASHPNLTIFVREKRSYVFMQQYFPTVRCLLVPDVVTLLDIPDMTQSRKGILFCMRRDQEKALDDTAQQKMLAAVQKQYPREAIEFTDTVIDYDVTLENREEEVNKKLMQFSGARLIVTDRLHGMIFAALTNTPCIAMSNSNGKVKAVYEWIKDNDYIRFANSVVEFKQQLQTLEVNRQYIYAHKLVEHEFKPLYEEIRKLK